MKHVMYAEKSLFIDDAAADALIDYAAALADVGGSDTIRLQAVGDDGNEVEVSFLLNSATVLIVESSSASLDAAPNERHVAYMRRRTDQIRNPPQVQTQQPSQLPGYDFDELR